jgi:large subunit ribosomal protein L25
MFTLEAKIRKETAKETRANKRIPAVVYGKDVPSTSLSVDASAFLKLYREAGQNHVVTLKIEKEEHPTLIHEVVRHPVRGDFLHVDFLVIDMKKDTEVEIPVVLIGTAPAVLA